MENRNQKKVLIVEDDADIREGIAAMMIAEGFTPIAFGNGQEALQALSSEKISLFLLDVVIPGMGGLDILQMVRQNELYQTTPVIMITGESNDNQILDGYNYGADYYITKPFNAKQLHYGIKLCFPS